MKPKRTAARRNAEKGPHNPVTLLRLQPDVAEAADKSPTCEDAPQAGISRNITERKQAEQALRDNEARLRKVAETNEEMFRQMAEIIGQVSWLADPTGSRIVYISPAYEAIWGRKRESLYQSPTSWLDAIHPEDRGRVISSLPQPMTERYANEYRIVRPDGSVRWISDRRLPLCDESGAIYQIAGVAEDITERKHAQTALRDSEEQYRLLVEQSSDGIYLADPHGNLIFGNTRGREMLGYSVEEFARLNIRDTYAATESVKAEERLHELQPGQTLQFERQMRRKDGTCFPVEVSLRMIRKGWYQGVVRDITERKRAEEALARERNLLRTLIETLPDRIYVKDTEARFILNNVAHLRGLGAKSQEEATGKTDFDFRPPELAARYFADDKHVIETGQPLYNKEMVGVTDNGQIGWLRVNKAPLRDSQGNIIGLVGITQDLTDRKRVEEALAYERDLLKALMDNIPDHIYFKDRESRFIRISRAQAQHFGVRDPSEAIGKTDFDFFTTEHAQPAFDDEQQILRTGQSIISKEEKETHPDGRVTWVSTTKEPLRDHDGNVIGTFGVSRDITDRKRAEEALREAEGKYRALVEESFVGVYLITENGFEYFNEAGARIFGYRPAEIVGRLQPPELIQPEDRPLAAEKVRQRLSGELGAAQYIYRGRRKDGSTVYCEAFGRRIDYHGRPAILCTVVDVTDRKRAEEALAHERDLLKALMDNIPDHIYFKDRESRFIRISRAQAQHFGVRDPSEAIGKTDFDFFTAEHAQPAFDDEQQIMHTGQSIVSKEEKETHPDGRVTWVSTTKEPLRDHDGNIIGTFGISRDITERKIADETLKTYAERLERSNRDLQDFAYIASHDLQEPLRKIQAFGDRLRAKYNDVLGETGRDYLTRMFDAAGRMQILINDLLSFSRVTTKAQPFAPVDLDKVLREVLSDLEVRIEQTRGQVEVGRFGTIDADALQMRQLFQNLIGNALKFHKENESPVIRVHGHLLNSDSPPRMEITVTDNGIGFDQKYADRIFGIFQRLHGRGQYEGTGVGLAVCKKIVERHGGLITAEGRPGDGATFTVTLPVNHSNGDDKP